MALRMEPGGYRGGLKEAAVTTSKSGKDRMELVFDVGGFSCRVDLYLSDAAWPYTREKLERLGFNGDFDNPSFSAASDVELVMKAEKGQDGTTDFEKWDIGGGGVRGERSKPDALKRYRAKWTQSGGATAPAPRTPPPAPPKPAAPPPPGAAEKAFLSASTRDEAWQVWTEQAGPEGPNPDRWYIVVGDTAKAAGKPEEQFGEAEWSLVARKAIPI